MKVEAIPHGPDSPFDPEERETIVAVMNHVAASDHPQARSFGETIRQQIGSLESLGTVVASYPSPRAEQTLGERRRTLHTLVEALSNTDPASFEFHLPTRAVLGQALVMAESNFYRFLRLVCMEVVPGEDRRILREQVTRRLRICLYTKLAEEVLSVITTDSVLPDETRSKAVVALAQIWERRLTYRVSDFFPILEATWEARQRVTAVGGTLGGTQELFALFQAGCDPEFVAYFARANPTEDETEAFREFLFAATTEDLDRMAKEMAAAGRTCMLIGDETAARASDPAVVFYEFYRSRHLQAVARRLAGVAGPKHTAEAYVMIYYLDRMD